MAFVHRVPKPPLDAFVGILWYCENESRPFALERVLPHGYAQLIVNLREDETRMYRPETDFRCETTSGSILSGIHSRYSVIDTAEQECVAGVTFKPGGTLPFFALPASELRDVDVPLELLWRSVAAELRDRLLSAPGPQRKMDVLEDVLLKMFRPAEPHRAVKFALTAFERASYETSIGTVSDLAGLSAKRFIERFKAEVGIVPKRYCRILRFQRALHSAQTVNRIEWTRIAADCGYFDQAHFIRDFRSFSGLTPTGYEAGRTEFQNHVKFLQSSDATP